MEQGLGKLWLIILLTQHDRATWSRWSPLPPEVPHTLGFPADAVIPQTPSEVYAAARGEWERPGDGPRHTAFLQLTRTTIASPCRDEVHLQKSKSHHLSKFVVLKIHIWSIIILFVSQTFLLSAARFSISYVDFSGLLLFPYKLCSNTSITWWHKVDQNPYCLHVFWGNKNRMFW